MPVKIRIIQCECRKGHRAIASCAISRAIHGRLVEVCVACYSCAPYYDLIPQEEALSAEAIHEIESPCEGMLYCAYLPNNPLANSARVDAGMDCYWIIQNQYRAFLAWRSLIVYAINPNRRDAPQEVKAAAAAHALSGVSL